MNPLMDELTFRSYVHNRMMFPDVQPERWAAIFKNVPAMEERFLKTFIAKLMQEIEVADGSGLPNSGVTQGNSGVSSASERKPSGEDSGCQVRSLDAHQAADSSSLPVPLGREVSGVAEGCDEQMRALHTEQGQVLTANGGMNQFARSCNKSEIPASPADQILEVSPRQEQPAKAVNHESGTGAVANRKPLDKTNCVTSIKNANNLAKGADSTATESAPEIFSYFLLAEIVEKVFKQRSFLCN